MKLAHTRAIVDAIHSGSLSKAEYTKTPIFELQARPPLRVPTSFKDWQYFSEIPTSFQTEECYGVLLFSRSAYSRLRMHGGSVIPRPDVEAFFC